MSLNFFKKFFRRSCNNENMVAFLDGRLARDNGFIISDNPYKQGTKQKQWWNGGWYAVNQRMKRRLKCKY